MLWDEDTVVLADRYGKPGAELVRGVMAKAVARDHRQERERINARKYVCRAFSRFG